MRFFFLFILVVCCTVTNGQESKVERIDYLELQAQRALREGSSQEAIVTLNKLFAIYERENDVKKVFKTILQIAFVSRQAGELELALRNYEAAVRLQNKWNLEVPGFNLQDSVNLLRRIINSDDYSSQSDRSVVSGVPSENSNSPSQKGSAGRNDSSPKRLKKLEKDIKESEAVGDLDKANSLRENYNRMLEQRKQDSVRFAQITADFENEKKWNVQALERQEARAKEAEVSNQRLYYIASVIVLLALIFYYLFTVKRKAHGKLEEAYQQQQDTMKKLKGMQQQLITSEKMASLGQLTAGIAHEINNPINYVANNITPLKRDMDDLRSFFRKVQAIALSPNIAERAEELNDVIQETDPDFLFLEMTDLLDGIEEGAGRTKTIVKGLRNFSRLDEDDFKQADVNDGLLSTLAILQNRISNRMELDKQFSKLKEIECQPGKLNQVFMNLLNNSIQAVEERLSKFPGREGKLSIFTEMADEQSVLIRIRDNGIGIEKEKRNRIFEPFYTTKDVGVGTGLGLSISYGIIEQHHGSIEVKSQTGEKSYTEFQIVLPVNQPVAAGSSTEITDETEKVED